MDGLSGSTGLNPKFWGEGKALPGLDLVNKGIHDLKMYLKYEKVENYDPKKVDAYLAYRVITYTFVPLIANTISILISLVLILLTFPTCCFTTKYSSWCWKYLKGSTFCLIESLFDFTCDFRMLTGWLCSPDSIYNRI